MKNTEEEKNQKMMNMSKMNKLMKTRARAPSIIETMMYIRTTYMRMFKLPKRAIRIVANSKYNAHTDPLFKLHRILKLSDHYRL